MDERNLDPARPPPQPLPTTVLDYELVSRLGEGGFGVVYEGRTRRPPVVSHAIKILEPSSIGGDGGSERFLREVESVARLSHRAIVPFIAAGFTTDRVPMIVMSLVEGEPLHNAARRLNYVERVALLVEVLAGLEHAHQNGVLHRDIKPSNILVRASDGQPVIVDFGLAYVWEGLSTSSLTTSVAGSLGYVPPEVQVDPRHRSVTHDVFSCAVTLYEVIAGRRPNVQAYSPLARIDPMLLGLDQIVQRGLGEETVRFPTCKALGQALQEWLLGKRSLEKMAASKYSERLREQLAANKSAEEQRRSDELRQPQAPCATPFVLGRS